MKNINTSDRPTLKAVFNQRVTQMANFLGYDLVKSDTLGELVQLLEHIAPIGDSPLIWLTLATFLGTLPLESEFLQLKRALNQTSADHAARILLKFSKPNLGSEVQIITNKAVVEIAPPALSAQPREALSILRHSVPKWRSQHDFELVRWNSEYSSIQRIPKDEIAELQSLNDVPSAIADSKAISILPYNTSVIFASGQVPDFTAASRIACLATHSGNNVSFIGYGFQPLVHADQHQDDPSKVKRAAALFAALKYARQVATISDSAEAEVAGLVLALPTQGLSGPNVRNIPIPHDDPQHKDPYRTTWESYANNSWDFLTQTPQGK
jgi:hypothetical protein